MREQDFRDNENIQKTLGAARYVYTSLCLATGSAAAASIVIVCYFIANVINDRYYKPYYTATNTITDFLLGRGLSYLMMVLLTVLVISGISGFIVYRSSKTEMREDPRNPSEHRGRAGEKMARRGAMDTAYLYIRRCRQQAHGNGWMIFLIVAGCVYAAASILIVAFVGDRMRTAAHVRWSVTASRIEEDLGLRDATYEISDPDGSAQNYCTVVFKNASVDGFLTFTIELNLDGKIGEPEGNGTLCQVNFRYEPDQDFSDETFVTADSAITRVLEALQTDRDLFTAPELMDNIPEMPFSVVSRIKTEETVSFGNGCEAVYSYYGSFLEMKYSKEVQDTAQGNANAEENSAAESVGK